MYNYRNDLSLKATRRNNVRRVQIYLKDFSSSTYLTDHVLRVVEDMHGEEVTDKELGGTLEMLLKIGTLYYPQYKRERIQKGKEWKNKVFHSNLTRLEKVLDMEGKSEELDEVIKMIKGTCGEKPKKEPEKKSKKK